MNQGIEFVQSSTPVKIYTKLKNVLKKWDLRDCSICFDVDETLLLNHEDDSYSVIKEARSFYNECKNGDKLRCDGYADGYARDVLRCL